MLAGEEERVPKYSELAYALLRITLGVMFLFFGVGKFVQGLPKFVSGIEDRFAQSWLPPTLVTPFAYVLPFVEVTIGALLIIGLFTVAALVAAAVLMIALTFGTVVESNQATTARNVNYALIVFVLLFLVRYNAHSVDGARDAGAEPDGARG